MGESSHVSVVLFVIWCLPKSVCPEALVLPKCMPSTEHTFIPASELSTDVLMSHVSKRGFLLFTQQPECLGFPLFCVLTILLMKDEMMKAESCGNVL